MKETLFYIFTGGEPVKYILESICIHVLFSVCDEGEY